MNNSPIQKVKRIAIGIVLVISGLLWIIPSDVPYLIARRKVILLGRYSEGHFSVLVAIWILSIVAIYILKARSGRVKERCFKVCGVCFGICIGLFIADVVLRQIRRPRYVKTQTVYHRPPNSRYIGVFKDQPRRVHSYPGWPRGYEDVNYVLTTGHRGFRNKCNIGQCEILFVGDSFVEGSEVSDEQTWPEVFSQLSGKKIYNLGMSGGNPGTYVETLKLFIESLKPKIVVCSIYEGNDFRGDGTLSHRNSENGKNDRAQGLIKFSPLRLEIKKLLKNTLSFDSRSELLLKNQGWQTFPFPSSNFDAVNWLPMRLPMHGSGSQYAFGLRNLMHHYLDNQSNTNSPEIRTVTAALQEINKICQQQGARLIVAFAPDKQHVLVPLIRDNIDPELIRSFLSLKLNDLPSGTEVLQRLCENVNYKESATMVFCQILNIEFLSLTEILREAISKGIQTYYTYDHHWTPIGNQIAAEALHNYIQQSVFKSIDI